MVDNSGKGERAANGTCGNSVPSVMCKRSYESVYARTWATTAIFTASSKQGIGLETLVLRLRISAHEERALWRRITPIRRPGDGGFTFVAVTAFSSFLETVSWLLMARAVVSAARALRW